MTAHDINSPSKLWLRELCPGSARLSATLADVAGPPAERGRKLHEALAHRLTTRSHPVEGDLGTAREDFDALYGCWQIGMQMRKQADASGAVTLIEQPVNLTRIGITHGTIDFALVWPGDRFHLVDWKFGALSMGHANLRQQQAYAVGLLDDYGCDNGAAEVIQPALGTDPRVTLYVPEQLARIAPALRAIVDRAKTPDAPLVPGDHCSFCPAADSCPARKAIAESVIAQRPMPPAEILAAIDPAKRLDYYDRLKLAKAWLEAQLDAVDSSIVAGLLHVPGLTVADGRKARTWVDETEARKTLTDLIGDRATALISPAAAEKALGKEKKKAIAKLVAAIPGKPRVVREGAGGLIGEDA